LEVWKLWKFGSSASKLLPSPARSQRAFPSGFFKPVFFIEFDEVRPGFTRSDLISGLKSLVAEPPNFLNLDIFYLI